MDPLSDPATWPPPPPSFPPPPQQPFPFPADNNNNHHPQIPPPPYPEMIITAITALKEREGSSRQAIAKYIQSVYLNLPENHSSQLTWHLKKMKAEGALAMVKHSYALPGSVPIPVPVSENPSSATPPGSKRGPGRPPKAKTPSQTRAVAVGPAEGQPNAETMLVSLGLVDGPPGDTPAPVKRGRGRPPRAQQQPALPSAAKKGRGRPPRVVRAPRAVVPIPVVPTGAGRRGRPPKAGGKPRGRPRKVVVAGAGIGGVGAGVAVKRRGRPPRAGGPVKKPRRLSGKPLGRPKKNALLPANQVAAQHLVAYQDLKNKLEHFQSRVKAAVDLVRPYFTRETAPYAYGALQELEELANTDMTAPPQAPPQAQPQQPLAVTQS